MQIIIGMFIGVILMLFVAWVDEQIVKTSIINVSRERSKFMNYLVASCWEILFFIGGIMFGKWIL